ncbi:MAG: hypothetical protein Phog2KO_33040 [Phototrophicaceae bacterium]
MIVLLRAEHIADCARIMTENTLWQNYDVTQADAEAQLRSGLTSYDARILVQLEKEVVTGFIWYYIKGTFHRGAYIRLIGIHPDFQGKGIGTHLMTVAEADIMTTTRDVFLLSSDFNEDAHRFYHRLGYNSVGELADFAKEGITETIFLKRLK